MRLLGKTRSELEEENEALRRRLRSAELQVAAVAGVARLLDSDGRMLAQKWERYSRRGYVISSGTAKRALELALQPHVQRLLDITDAWAD